MMKKFARQQLSQSVLKGQNVKTKEEFKADVTDKTALTLYSSPTPSFQVSVCICMLLKDNEVSPAEVLGRLLSLRTWFKSTYMIFVSTAANLHTQYSAVPNSIFLNLNGMSDLKCRNAYLNIVLENRHIFNVMLVLDPAATLKNDLKYPSFLSFTPERYGDWDVLFANQSYKYYDAYNIVKDSSDVPNPDEPNQDDRKKQKHQSHIPCDSGYINVKSAFGGLAAYKTSIFSDDLTYGPDEHVSFNIQLSEKTNRVYIDSSMVIETHPSNTKLYV